MYWFQEPSQLWKTDKLAEVIPTSSMSYPDKHNALVRLSIYIGLVLTIIFRCYLWLYVPLLTMCLSYILYAVRTSQPPMSITESMSQKLDTTSLDKVYDAQNELEHFTGTVSDATYPTSSNPFMNPMPFDDRTRPEAAENQGAKIERQFNRTLFREVSDIFNKENSQREFFTVPNTTYPSNQTGFAEWLYKVPTTCKDGNGGQCVANNEGRLYGGGNGSFKLPYITNKFNHIALGI